MKDAAHEIYAAGQRCRSIGPLIGGVVALKSMADELFVFLPGETLKVASGDVNVTEAGIDAAGRLVVPFDGAGPWDKYGGPDGTCVSFTLGDGPDGLIAPATRPADMDPGLAVKRFFEDCSQDDDVFLQDIGAYVPDGDDRPEERLYVMRRSAHYDRYGDDDVLIVRGHRLPLVDMTWAESETDGSGNRHLHLVMADGRYLRVGAGDFSR